MIQFRLRVGDRWYEVEVGDLRKSPISVRVNGRLYQVELAAKAPPVEAPRKVEEVKPSAPRREVKGKEEVSAPMPGKIVSVKVGVGDRVEYRDVLCILEAMKMENEIMAPCGGVIKEVRVSEGQDVGHGDVLFVIG